MTSLPTDFQVPNFWRVNHKRDPVAIIPGRKLGYRHTRGEFHILGPGHAVACPGAHLCPPWIGSICRGARSSGARSLRPGRSLGYGVEKIVLRDDAGVDEDAGDDGVQESRILTDELTGGPYDFTDLKPGKETVFIYVAWMTGKSRSATSLS
jgi:hypothetical protein